MANTTHHMISCSDASRDRIWPRNVNLENLEGYPFQHCIAAHYNLPEELELRMHCVGGLNTESYILS